MDASQKMLLTSLANQINKHDNNYYIKSDPSISDQEYDKLKDTYRNLVKKYGFDIKISPLNKVGSSLGQTGGEKVKHKIPMLSLQNTYNKGELDGWVNKTNESLNVYGESVDIEYSVEAKADGVSLSARYLGGKLVKLVTRGDGVHGEDVTHLAPYFESGVPLEIPDTHELDVRGEGVIFKDDFLRINKKEHSKGRKGYANPRNLAGGSLSLQDMSKFKDRKMRFIVFDAILKNSEEKVHMLELNGFDVVDGIICEDIESINEAVSKFENEKDGFEYEIDGAVIKYTNVDYREVLGARSQSPKWAVAYKFKQIASQTPIQSVTWHVGSQGQITPVANLRPVDINGSRVSRCTLHNIDEIERLGVQVGDIVNVIKAAEIIPKITSVNMKTVNSSDIVIPDKCPGCGGLVQKISTSLHCMNPSCEAKNIRSLQDFVSKEALDIQGLGDATIVELKDLGFITDHMSIFSLQQHTSDIMELPGWGETSAKALMYSIQSAKNIEPHKAVRALDISEIGKSKSKLLWHKVVDKFGELRKPSLVDLLKLTVEDLISIEGIGRPTAEKAMNSIMIKAQFITRLDAALILEEEEPVAVKGDLFKDKRVCVTGSFENFNRNDIADMIQEQGGYFVNSVSNTTDILIAGENPKSKLAKAKSLNKRILYSKDIEEYMEV